MSTITWLHLSDLHFREGEQHTWDENIVLRALLEDVRERIDSNGLIPNFIAVTGDIAFGGKPAEYDLAAKFFDRLLDLTRLGKDSLFVVPGNHDVDRKVIGAGVALARSVTSREGLAELQRDEQARRLILRKLDGYARFVNSYLSGHLGFDDERYFYTQRLDLGACELAVLGLNSAFLSVDDSDKDKLALGERSVHPALEQAKGARFRLALLHHPFEWFSTFERQDCGNVLMSRCDFILHGHLHETGLMSLATPDAATMIIAAGACYQSRQYPNGYNWVELDLETGQGVVRLRTYSNRGAGFWTKDAQTYKNVPDGEYRFDLPKRTRTAPKKAARRTAPADVHKLEASYLRRVQRVSNALPMAIIDPHAVERTHRQSMDLLPVYVALNTLTQTPLDEKEKKTARKRGGAEAMMEGGRETRPLSALEAASRERQLVLLGDPGSGKSTFANYLALCLAGARLESSGAPLELSGERWLSRLQPTWTHGPLLPVQVTLRHFGASPCCDGTAAGLWRFIEEALAASDLADYASHLRPALLDGGVLMLLDGLDEVADPAKRRTVRDAVADFANTYNAPGNRYLVTCRVYAYQGQDCPCRLDSFTAHTLASFTQEQIDAFIACWYSEVCRLGWKNQAEAEDLTRRLREASRRTDLAPLAATPLQLTMMTSLHFSWGQLPDDRVKLYQQMVELLLVRWQKARLGPDAGGGPSMKAEDLESALERLAFGVHKAQGGGEGVADISQADLLDVLQNYLEHDWNRARDMAAYIQERAGLLIDRGKGTYTFPHRSYQEYLAACHLAVQPDFRQRAARLIGQNYAQWREVVLWAVAVMARLKKLPHVAVDVASSLCPEEYTVARALEGPWRRAHLAGEALVEVGERDVLGVPESKPVLDRVSGWLVQSVEGGVESPVERGAAGRTLARLGDPRPGVTTLEGMKFCYVPAGPFWMGGNRYDDEKPLRPNDCLDCDYWISRYPLTNGQYAEFVKAGGYAERSFWSEALSHGLWKNGKLTCRTWFPDQRDYKEAQVDTPQDYGEPFNLPNHPRVGVSWYEALAFTRWLSGVWKDRLPRGWSLCPPSEAQWEKAARGGKSIPAEPIRACIPLSNPEPRPPTDTNPIPKREYPWGDQIDPDRANYDATGIGSTSAVGSFPKGAGPYGCEDLSGNVWEWTRSLFKPYPYNPTDGREDAAAGRDEGRVLRGGAFYYFGMNVRSAVRSGSDPDLRVGDVGFRVVVSRF